MPLQRGTVDQKSRALPRSKQKFTFTAGRSSQRQMCPVCTIGTANVTDQCYWIPVRPAPARKCNARTYREIENEASYERQQLLEANSFYKEAAQILSVWQSHATRLHCERSNAVYRFSFERTVTFLTKDCAIGESTSYSLGTLRKRLCFAVISFQLSSLYATTIIPYFGASGECLSVGLCVG